jgi:hypothetical protein
MNINVFKDNKFMHGTKVKLPDHNNTLQLQAGMKPIRALQKIAKYFQGTQYEKYFKHLEEFRIKHSMMNNDDVVDAKMVFSIHPLDFITMSDNSLNWSSCMCWTGERGCYSVGTVEMMNSNNVICCYIKDKTPFYFDEDNKDDAHTWNNKRWRCLAYCTNDIIMSGKAYPYQNDNNKKFIIKVLKELAEKNLGRTYAFGPELYKDMIHIGSNHRMENNRDWIRLNDTFKHNIIWDTKGMYNDMLNDSGTHYWCYRNKVKKTKIISVSGKAPCLCCGEQVPQLEDLWDEDYNDRYIDVGQVVCNECLSDCECDFCYDRSPLHTYYKVRLKDGGHTYKFCESCFEKYIKRCPCCGEPFLINDFELNRKPDYYEERDAGTFVGYYCPDGNLNFKFFDVLNPIKSYTESVHVCKKCKESNKFLDAFKEGTIKYTRNRYGWGMGTVQETNEYDFLLLKEEYQDYRYKNLKTAPKDITEI